MNYCHFCEACFVSGDRCRTEKQRDRCGEYKSIRGADEFCAACGRHRSVHPYDLCGIFIPHEEAASNRTQI